MSQATSGRVSRPVARGSSVVSHMPRSRATDATATAVMITALTTHDWQMASISASSTYVRYALKPARESQERGHRPSGKASEASTAR